MVGCCCCPSPGISGASPRGLSSAVVSGEKTLHLVPGHTQNQHPKRTGRGMTASDPAVNALWSYLSAFCWSQAGHRDQSMFKAGDRDSPTSQWESVKGFAEPFFFFKHILKKKNLPFPEMSCITSVIDQVATNAWTRLGESVFGA